MSGAESGGSSSPHRDEDADNDTRSPAPATNGRNVVDEDDDDDDIVISSKRRARQLEQRPVQQDDEDDNDDADLFGDGSDDGEQDQARPHRTLDDAELDSGDDEDRHDRTIGEDDEMEQPEETVQLNIMEAEIARHPVPEPSDGELYQLRVPKYLSFEPRPFDPDHFRPPTTDHHSTGPPSSTFNAANIAKTTVRWRHSPLDRNKLESNARILRWSDGSLTLQLASNPTAQYLLPGEPLTQVQQKPPKPTPTTRLAKKLKNKSYREEQESFTYLVSPVVSSGILRFVDKFTTSLTVQPTESNVDDALIQLKQSMEAAKARGINTASKVDKGINLIHVEEDPELARKRAEQAEKELLKAERRREQQLAREREGGTVKSSRTRVSGLTLGALEEEMGMGTRRPTGRGRAKQRGRRGEIYSDDEEPVGRRGHTKEDEYDEEDDFIARSDEEELVEEGDDDEEDLGLDEDEEEEEEAPPAQRGFPERQTTPKRTRQDAEDEPAPAQGSPSARLKRRRVIEDDEDDE